MELLIQAYYCILQYKLQSILTDLQVYHYLKLTLNCNHHLDTEWSITISDFWHARKEEPNFDQHMKFMKTIQQISNSLLLLDEQHPPTEKQHPPTEQQPTEETVEPNLTYEHIF